MESYMYTWLFDDEPSIAEQIPEPRKEQGGDNTNPVAPRPVVKERHVDVNVNVNYPKGANEPPEKEPEGVSSDTITVPDAAVPEWTESNSDATDLTREAMESYDVVPLFKEHVNHSNYGSFNAALHEISLMLGENFAYCRNSKYLLIGNEGLVSFVGAAVDKVHDVVNHLLAIFKTALFDGWRDFKRSELNFYYDKAGFRVKRLFRLPYETCANVELYIPQGMTTPYSKTVEDSLKCLDVINMDEQSKNILKAAEGVLTNLRSGGTNFNSVVDDLRSDFLKHSDADRVFDIASRNFSDRDKSATSIFQKQFKTMQQFKDCVVKVADVGNRYLQGVASIHSRLEETEEVVSEICDIIERDNRKEIHISRSQIDILSKVARAWAVLFDHYAVIINDIQRLDHNLYLSLEHMIDTVDA